MTKSGTIPSFPYFAPPFLWHCACQMTMSNNDLPWIVRPSQSLLTLGYSFTICWRATNFFACMELWLASRTFYPFLQQPTKDKFEKHCQRHNGPEGWVHLAKVASWGHITTSNTNLDHISSSESRLSIKNLNQTSASPLNLKFKILAKPSFRISTEI